MRIPRLIVAIWSAMTSVALLGMPTMADEYVVPTPPAPGFFTDSKDVWYCIHPDITSSQADHIHLAMQYMDSATNLYDISSGSCGTSTDIWFFTSSAPGGMAGARGHAGCAAPLGFGVCDVAWISYSPGQIFLESTDSFNYLANLSKTLRHEVGHVLGLRHSNGGGNMGQCMSQSPPCSQGDANSYQAMKSGWVETHIRWVEYNPHHIHHVNVLFP